MKWRYVVYAASIIGLGVAVLGERREPNGALVEPVARMGGRPLELSPKRATDSKVHLASGSQADALLALIPRGQLGGINGAGAQTQAAGTAFSARSWAPPPAVASSPTLDVPTPQPLPFSYIGKQAVGDAWQVFIAEKDDVRMVQVADLIDDQYRVLSIDGHTMTMDYIPLHAKLSISLE